MSIPVKGLNHAVLYVRDVERAVAFYEEAFGFEVVAREGGGRMAFLRAGGGTNHHDLGLMEVGANAPQPPRGSTGLYHLAWEVPTIKDLAEAHTLLANLGALTGQSDHGATKSLYGQDPDGNEFEVMWMVPREDWGANEKSAIIAPLRMSAEVAKYGSA
ncbi:MAG: VOC family protein [Tepidiformaceae bacterium]